MVEPISAMLWAKRSVQRLSFSLLRAGLRLAIKSVLQLPPSDSCSK